MEIIIVIEPVSPLGSNHTSLRMWAAFSNRGRGELHSETEPVTTPVMAQSAPLESVPKPATLEMATGPHVMTCKCTLCCSAGLDTIASPVGGAKIVSVNLTGTLSEEEKQTVDALRQRDAQVRRHEQAHLVAAGQHAIGGAQYTYQVGPDGKRYAIGGEVQVDMAPVQGDPEATLRKAQQLQQAALAPVDPSGADRSVAVAAAQMAQEARQEIQEENREEMEAIREKKQEKNGAEAGDNSTKFELEIALSPGKSLQPFSLYETQNRQAVTPSAAQPDTGRSQSADSSWGLDLYV